MISYSLCEVFNLSTITGVFPEEWKCSKVIPLFKQGERADINNYRPISIIPVVAKVFERIIYDQLYAYLSDNNMIAHINQVFDLFTQRSQLYLMQLIIGLIILIKEM